MNTNYYALFNLKKQFDIDSTLLEARYIELQKQFHPDNNTDSLLATRQISLVNDAYHTLKEPLKRAHYLAIDCGIILGDKVDAIKPSQDILLESMEARETLLEAETLQTLHALHTQNTAAIAAQEVELIQLFKDNNNNTIAQAVIRLGYLVKLNQEITLRIRQTSV